MTIRKHVKKKTKTEDPAESNDNYRLKRVRYGALTGIAICLQNKNGPCPLLAIANALLLRGEIHIHPDLSYITEEALIAKLTEYVYNVNKRQLSKATNDGNTSEEIIINNQANLAEVVAILPRLKTGIDVNVRFGPRPDSFEFTREVACFDMFRTRLVHGWLPNPDDAETYQALGEKSFNQTMDTLIKADVSDSPSEVVEANGVHFAPSEQDASASQQNGILEEMNYGSMALPPGQLGKNPEMGNYQAEVRTSGPQQSENPASLSIGSSEPDFEEQEAPPLFAERSDSVQLYPSPSTTHPMTLLSETRLATDIKDSDAGRVVENEAIITNFEYERDNLRDEPSEVNENHNDDIENDVRSTGQINRDVLIEEAKDEGTAVAEKDVDESKEVKGLEETIKMLNLGNDAKDSDGKDSLPERIGETDDDPFGLFTDSVHTSEDTEIEKTEDFFGFNDAQNDAPTLETPLQPIVEDKLEQNGGDKEVRDGDERLCSDEVAQSRLENGSIQTFETSEVEPNPQVPQHAGDDEMNGLMDSESPRPLHLDPSCPDRSSSVRDGEKERADHIVRAAYIREFLNSFPSQLTFYGLAQLHQFINEGEMCVFFRNNHFSTLTRNKNELYVLVSDLGYLHEPDVVWEKLNDLSGNTEFTNGSFHSFTAHKPAISEGPAPTAPNLTSVEVGPIQAEDSIPSAPPLDGSEFESDEAYAAYLGRIEAEKADAAYARRLQQQEAVTRANNGNVAQDAELAKRLQASEQEAAARRPQNQRTVAQRQQRQSRESMGRHRRQSRSRRLQAAANAAGSSRARPAGASKTDSCAIQ